MEAAHRAGNLVGMHQAAKKPVVFRLLNLVMLFFASYFFTTSKLFAHGGGLDQRGGHNCNVGSCAGTYHYHQGNGGSAGFDGLFAILFIALLAYGFWYFTRTPDDHKPRNLTTQQNVRHGQANSVNKNVTGSVSQQNRSLEKVLHHNISELQNRSQWYEKTNAFDKWLIGYVFGCLLIEKNFSEAKVFLDQDGTTKFRTFGSLKNQIISIFSNSLNSKSSATLVLQVPIISQNDEDFKSGFKSGRLDAEHFIKTGEFRDSTVLALKHGQQIEIEARTNHKLKKAYIDENELTEQKPTPGAIVKGADKLDGWNDRSVKFEIWFIGYVAAFIARKILADDAEGILQVGLWLKNANWDLLSPELKAVFENFSSIEDAKVFGSHIDEALIHDPNWEAGYEDGLRSSQICSNAKEALETCDIVLKIERST